MNIKDFNEALYALSNGVVVERRKRTIIPFAILLAGIAMLVANLFVESNDYTDNLKSALIYPCTLLIKFYTLNSPIIFYVFQYQNIINLYPGFHF